MTSSRRCTPRSDGGSTAPTGCHAIRATRWRRWPAARIVIALTPSSTCCGESCGCRRCRAGAAAYAWLAWPARTWHCHLHGSNHRQQRTAFEAHNGRSALAAGTGLHAPKLTFAPPDHRSARRCELTLSAGSNDASACRTDCHTFKCVVTRFHRDQTNGRSRRNLAIGERGPDRPKSSREPVIQMIALPPRRCAGGWSAQEDDHPVFVAIGVSFRRRGA
jgi:hypothetical protein